ncbi:hypothetical protein GDO78_005246 [Eleutherodactylus coqui]|uniref:Treslin STD domain-containing protein n=1 Tax=Eleutherodactylus coqui TaxID=57060 RepID=A0A8J6FLK8_ELECQ|nr:hypothetical protein GDO78_005246 [Eleutherodactylus coqui]
MGVILFLSAFLICQVAEVWTEDLLPRTGVLSPISETAAVLSVICSDQSAEFDRLRDKTAEGIDEEISSDLPDIVNAVLGPILNTKENPTSPGLPRTPVRQKIKTMPRALQMLNAARLNSKAQNLQPKGGPVEKSSQTKRKSSEKPEGKSRKQTGFKSEEELNSFLTEGYNKMVSDEEDSLLSCVRNTLTTIKSFWKMANSQHIEIDSMDKVKLLLKTSKSIRKLYGQKENKVAKLRECQIQALLRLEMCVQCPSLQTNEEELEQVVEEITDMLRIISLTEDPSYLTKFLTDVLTEYIGSIPKILADIYFSLGIQIPEELKMVLPADGDDSFLLDGKTPMYSEPSIPRVLSVPHAVNEEDQLEDLRTRSAKKRKTSTVARHRSITESSQSLRQIELPKKPLNRERSGANLVVMVEKLKLPLPAKTQKDSEATKARRNLFVQENRSPTRRSSKMPRSQSVSAVEGLKHQRSKSHDGTKDHCKLLTKKVTETPVHKQMAKRLIYKQIKGRCSESTSNISVVEESPEKELTELDLRRSPRIKQLAMAKKNSSFYASQPKSRNLERVHSTAHQMLSGGSTAQPEAKTPKDLLFGEVLGLSSPPTRRARRKLLAETDPRSKEVLENFETVTPSKVQKPVPSREQSTENQLLQGSHRIPRTPVRTPKMLKTPSKVSEVKRSAAKNLERIFSPSKIEEKTPSKSAERRSERLARTTPSHSGSSMICLVSPLKTIRQPFTPRKAGVNKSQDEVFRSPQKTPQQSANTNTPARITQPACTPRKSPRLQSLSKPCVTPTRYVLRTPEKLPEAPTPKKLPKNRTLITFSLECTPKKATFFSPGKTADRSQSQSNLGSLSMTPCRPILKTPTKSIQKDVKLSSAQEDVDTCKNMNSVNNLPLKETDGGLVELDLPSTSSLRNACETAKVLSSSIKSPSIYKVLSLGKDDPIVLCERLDMSSLESSEGTESFVNTSPTDESIDITEAKIVPTDSGDLKMKVLIKRKSSDAGLLSHMPSTPKGGGDTVCTSPYGLRCTVNRRQREAAARLGTPQIPAKFSTPKNNNHPPVYEVELEMQASGLPKLRFKRTDSNSTIDLGTLPKTIESPNGPQSKKGNESPFGETWCNKHPLKLDSACTSPCLRSSHNTPGKSGLQTLICQTYTPKRSSSNTASPSQPEAVSPWTPSPKYKDKNGGDVINNWPRKKRAFPVKSAYVLKQEKIRDAAGSALSVEEASAEHESSKASPSGDLLVEGVSKLLEQSPVFDWKHKTEIGAMSFKSRKRCFDFLSPTKDESSSKRSCTSTATCEDMEECIVSSSQTLSSEANLSQQSSCEDEVFDISTFTPPHKVLKSSLSTSGLLALTRSPMLFQGKTPSSKRKKQDSESQNSTPEIKRPAQQAVGTEDSPFSQVSRKRTISRTYTRKKLIT